MVIVIYFNILCTLYKHGTSFTNLFALESKLDTIMQDDLLIVTIVFRNPCFIYSRRKSVSGVN